MPESNEVVQGSTLDGFAVQFMGPGCWLWITDDRDGIEPTRARAIEAARRALQGST